MGTYNPAYHRPDHFEGNKKKAKKKTEAELLEEQMQEAMKLEEEGAQEAARCSSGKRQSGYKGHPGSKAVCKRKPRNYGVTYPFLAERANRDGARRFPSSRLTPLQKAAAVIITLGSENASKIYKHLREDEVERLSVEIAKFDHISPDEIREIVEDFYGLCITKKVISEGGIDYARDVLEKAFGPKQAQSFMERVTRSLQTRAFEFVRKADYKNLLAILQNEHPQTIALILSYARADQAAQVLAELPKERRIDVVERIANLDRANPEIIRLVEEVLAKV